MKPLAPTDADDVVRTIVNIGSVFGHAAPAAGMSAYCGSKFALAGLTRRVIARSRRRFVSVDRFGLGDDVAEAVAYLTDPKTSFVNGVCLNVDGGWSA